MSATPNFDINANKNGESTHKKGNQSKQKQTNNNNKQRNNNIKNTTKSYKPKANKQAKSSHNYPEKLQIVCMFMS